MLYEILCEEFNVKRIEFNQGLNVVLGDNAGNNSIGKSTFLMIIDFVFGGKDYILASTDIQRNVGSHVIQYCFVFDNIKYFFLRNTDELEYVYKCNSNYKILHSQTLDEYCDFLKEKYKILLNDISFRNIVGRYSRIYGKENLDEKHPLNIVPNEKAGAPTTALLKLFDLYYLIKNLDDLFNSKQTEFNAYKNAQKYNYISNIGKRQYNTNKIELTRLCEEKEKLALDLDSNLLDLSSMKTEELLLLKKQLSTAKRQRSLLSSQLDKFESNIDENKKYKNRNIDSLKDFFPNLHVRKIEEIEAFHIGIRKAVKKELIEKKAELIKLLQISEEQINRISVDIIAISQSSDLSKTILRKYADIQKKIERLETENSAFEKLDSLRQGRDDLKERRDKMKNEQLQKLQMEINNKMKEINDYIYDGQKQTPYIHFSNNQYTFATSDDTGTGTSYKSMIVYDLSVLELTVLPILIHDSVLLKQISDTAIEKILQKYSTAKKQIFISFDKVSSYSENSQKILNASKVLQLSTNGSELFGKSWNNKKVK